MLEELERTVWDMVIIDEAHHCVAERPREATQRRRLAEVLARRGDGLLLLTATPHDGHDAHFASLIELLDPSLVDASGRLIGSAYRRHVVRRLKSHIRDPRLGAADCSENASSFQWRRRHSGRRSADAAVSSGAVGARGAQAATVAAARGWRRAGVRQPAETIDVDDRSVSCHIARRGGTLRRGDRTATGTRRRARTATRAAGVSHGRRAVRSARPGQEATWPLEAEEMAANLPGHGDHSGPSGADPPWRGRVVARSEIGRAGAGNPSDPPAQPAANILVYTEYTDSQAAAVRRGVEALRGTVLTISGADPEPVRTRRQNAAPRKMVSS